MPRSIATFEATLAEYLSAKQALDSASKNVERLKAVLENHVLDKGTLEVGKGHKSLSQGEYVVVRQRSVRHTLRPDAVEHLKATIKSRRLLNFLLESVEVVKVDRLEELAEQLEDEAKKEYLISAGFTKRFFKSLFEEKEYFSIVVKST